MLQEQGLVLELQSGDFTVFWSSEITHFNMDYTGRWASLIMQTDIKFDKWTDGRNGWVDNNIFL